MRIAIVNDLTMARAVLRRVVQSREGFSVAWEAADGEEAARKALSDRPDVILMDLVMPNVDGVEATRRIMAASPCRVLVVTATVQGNYARVMQAMNHGAIDAIRTPEMGLDGHLRGAKELLDRLDRFGREHRAKPGSVVFEPPRPEGCGVAPALVALGASTGGPAAVSDILERLPATFRAPVVVVQHISADFATDMVTWLRGRVRLPVEAASEGREPTPGVVSVAVTNDHLVLTADRRFRYTADPADYPFRPSINAWFESLAARWPTPGVAALLTGMREDGARGLALLRRAGWLTIAQDQQTSVVYGMPRAAVELNAACRVLPVGEIAAAIRERLS